MFHFPWTISIRNRSSGPHCFSVTAFHRAHLKHQLHWPSKTTQNDNEKLVLAGDMLRRLMEDNAHIAKQLRNAIAVCDKNRDASISNSLREILDVTELRKWFLHEIL